MAAQSLDIKVLDHLIVTEKEYFSFADENLI
jgi:DNA repair protein RadC